jgi:hypothetical protein
MPATALPDKVSWHRRHARSWEALRRLPPRSLIRLYLAIFFVFSTFGFYLSLVLPFRLPLSTVLLLGAINGAYSVLYPWLFIRRPSAWIWMLFVTQFILLGGLSWMAGAGYFRHMPGPPASLLVTGHSIWALLVLSYACFIAFIRNQASAAIRMQNELELAHGIQQTLVPPIQSVNGL